MRKKLCTLLQHADLSEKEIALYLHLLTLRQTTIPRLRERLKLPNITVYRTLMKLEGRGLVKRTPGKKTATYEPLSLRTLAHAVSRQQRDLRHLELELQNLDPLLPFLDLDKQPADDIEIHSGLDAFRGEYLQIPEILKEEFLVLGSLGTYWNLSNIPDESPEERSFRHRRINRNVFARIIATPSPETERLQKMDSLEKRTTHIASNIPLQRDLLLLSKDVLYHFFCDEENPRVLIAHHPDIIRMHRDHFNLLWNKQ